MSNTDSTSTPPGQGTAGSTDARETKLRFIEPYLQERFESYILPEPNSGCWLWTGGLSGAGYGVFGLYGKSPNAHRLSYELYKGDIPEGKQLDHLRRTRSCVNPDHLEPVTRKENLLRGVSFSAENAEKTHCLRGHEFTAENTDFQVRKNGKGVARRCRTCNALLAKFRRNGIFQ